MAHTWKKEALWPLLWHSCNFFSKFPLFLFLAHVCFRKAPQVLNYLSCQWALPWDFRPRGPRLARISLPLVGIGRHSGPLVRRVCVWRMRRNICFGDRIPKTSCTWTSWAGKYWCSFRGQGLMGTFPRARKALWLWYQVRLPPLWAMPTQTFPASGRARIRFHPAVIELTATNCFQTHKII